MRALASAAMLVGVPLAVGWSLRLPRWPAALIWLLGAVACGVLCLALLALNVSLLVAPVLVLGLTAVTFMSRVTRPPTASTPGARTLAIILTGFVVMGTLITLARPVADFDALGIWHQKARAFAGGVPLAEWPVSQYPALGAILWGLPMLAGGAELEAIGRLVFMLAFVAWISSLCLIAPSPFTTRAALIVGAVGLGAFEHAAITSGYQDFFLMSVAGVAGVLLARDLLDESPPHAVTGALLAGTLGLIKAEGTIYGALLVATWIVASRSRVRPAAAWALGGYAALAASWPLIMIANGIGVQTSWVPDSVTLSLLIDRLDRLPVIIDALLKLRPTYWLPMAVAAALSVTAWRSLPDIRRTILWLWSLGLLHLAFIVGVFLLTNAPLDWHLTTALSRLAAQHGWIWSALIVMTTTHVMVPHRYTADT